MLERHKELKYEVKRRLTYLNYMQSHYAERLHNGDLSALQDLRTVQRDITDHYKEESAKIIVEAKIKNVESSEKTRIYHHALLKKKLKGHKSQG